MPLTKIKLPKKTNTQTNSYTGASGEVTIDTDKKIIVVHDGSTAGGHELLKNTLANIKDGAILDGGTYTT